jgi:hypothetical protein
MFSFENFSLTIIVALIVLAWLSFFSVIFAG